MVTGGKVGSIYKIFKNVFIKVIYVLWSSRF